MTSLFVTLAVALFAALLITPLVRRWATWVDMVDRPDGHRKLHGRTVPLGGGLAVLIAAVVGVLAILFIPGAWQSTIRAELPFLVGLLAAAVLLCGVGLIDDRFGLRGRQKLFGQTLAVGVLLAFGLCIERVQIFEWRVELGLLAYPLTLFWLLGAINALNLLDGVDGLATSVGLVLSLAIACMALQTGHNADALVALAVAGSLAGFLRYNFPPARIFLGDTGSMLIGLIMGTLAIRSSLKGPATIALAAPTAIWAIPIFDVSMAILRRKLTGRSIYTTDRGHLHHCLQRRGYSGRRTVITVGILSACTATAALVSVYQNDETLAYGGIAAVLGTLVVTRFFGHSECTLLCQRLRSAAISLIPAFLRKHERSVPLSTRFQGNREWDGLWTMLTDFAERFDLTSVRLNVHLPSIHEEYHASWARKPADRNAEMWHTEIPLMAGTLPVGRLKIDGVCRHTSVCEWMGELIAGLKPFETQMLELLEHDAEAPLELETAGATATAESPVAT